MLGGTTRTDPRGADQGWRRRRLRTKVGAPARANFTRSTVSSAMPRDRASASGLVMTRTSEPSRIARATAPGGSVPTQTTMAAPRIDRAIRRAPRPVDGDAAIARGGRLGGDHDHVVTRGPQRPDLGQRDRARGVGGRRVGTHHHRAAHARVSDREPLVDRVASTRSSTTGHVYSRSTSRGRRRSAATQDGSARRRSHSANPASSP